MATFQKQVATLAREKHCEPAMIVEVELSRSLPCLSAVCTETGRKYRRALSIVRLHSCPLGQVELEFEDGRLDADVYAARIWDALAQEIIEHLRMDGLPAPAGLTAAGVSYGEYDGDIHRDSQHEILRCLQARTQLLDNAPFVSVIVATRDRAESLVSCLDALLAMEYPNFEIVVVDNAPSTSATAECIERRYGATASVRYVREDQPGLAVAHNRGLCEIDAPIVAFTDDDVRVDKHWLTELVAGFDAAPNVGCVTGMIQPAELETPAQLWIEQYSGFSKGFAKRVFDLNNHRPDHPLFPYAAGTMGSGASMAFRTEILQAIGGFDSALGAGSKGVGGDDLAAFFEVVTHGYAVVYTPSALLYHWHRRDYAGLRKQAYGYGVGLFAYLTKVIVDKPSRIVDFALKAPHALYYLFSAKSPKNKNKLTDYPEELTWIERKGMLYGPLAYLASRKAVTQTGRLEKPV